MVRTVLTPENTHVEIDIPKEYVGKRIEITCVSLEEVEYKNTASKMSQFWGILSDETSESLRQHIDQSRKEWNRDI